MKTLSSIVACVVVLMAMSSCGSDQKSSDTSDDSILLLRLRGSNTETDERWNDIFSIIRENPGCCDEVWFSTGAKLAAFFVLGMFFAVKSQKVVAESGGESRKGSVGAGVAGGDHAQHKDHGCK